MATPQSQTPASVRDGSVSRRLISGSLNQSSRPYLIAGRKERTASVGKTAFVPLPNEGEDARITGSTRSLDRRLLALNLDPQARKSQRGTQSRMSDRIA